MCFCPLIRGFFFYLFIFSDDDLKEIYTFPSPHSGILFLLIARHRFNGMYFFFLFPSPHSGILFLSYQGGMKALNLERKFPSPHSGILFLCSFRKQRLSSTGGFRPLIRGFFFYGEHEQTINFHSGCFRPLIRGFFFYNHW